MSQNKNPQQVYKWIQKKKFNNFEEADALRNSLKDEGHIAKVKRCGPGGTSFKVLTGQLIKNNKVKENQNASK